MTTPNELQSLRDDFTIMRESIKGVTRLLGVYGEVHDIVRARHSGLENMVSKLQEDVREIRTGLEIMNANVEQVNRNFRVRLSETERKLQDHLEAVERHRNKSSAEGDKKEEVAENEALWTARHGEDHWISTA